MIDDHSKYHSKNSFCENAGPEEMRHLYELVENLSDYELKLSVSRVGINFTDDDPKDREVYEGVIDEADREVFYKEFRKIIQSR